MLADAPHAWIKLPIGKFMIFYPADAHAPLASTGDNVKAVIKVALVVPWVRLVTGLKP